MESLAQPFRWRAIVLFIGFLVAHVRIFTLVSLTRNGMAMVSIFVLTELLYDCFYTHRYYTLEHAWPPIPQLCSFFSTSNSIQLYGQSLNFNVVLLLTILLLRTSKVVLEIYFFSKFSYTVLRLC